MAKILVFLERFWFPFFLLALLLLAVPGLFLFLILLLGDPGASNDWLEENFQLRYHLVLPWLGALILFLVLPAIVLLYFLKLKRKPIQVSSTFLWRKSIEDLHVNSLFQWLRKNILLLLQLLTVLALIYAVMGFRFHGHSTLSRHYILVLDNSASMTATDVFPSRLHWAKQEALKEIDAAGAEDHGMVLLFNSKATTVQTYTNDRNRLRQAIQGIEKTQRSTRIEEALNLADSLANPVRATEEVAVRPEGEVPGQERSYVPPRGIPTTVHLFSDGRFAALSEAALASLNSRLAGNTSILGNLNLQYHMAGGPEAEKTNNLGIVAFKALRWAGDSAAPADPNFQKLQVLVRVRNFRLQPASVQLRLDVLVQGQIVHPEQKPLEVPGRKKIGPEDADMETVDEPGETSVSFLLPPLDLRSDMVLHAYLEKSRDSLAADDEAWLSVGGVRKAKVLLVGPGNPILEAFFDQEATQKVASVDRLGPADIAGDAYGKWARSGEVDLVIFDRCRPAGEKEMPQANTFFIDRPPPPWKRSPREVKNPYLVISKKGHPLLRHLAGFWDVGISEGFQFDIRKDLEEDRALYDLPDSDPRKKPLPVLTRLLEAGNEVPLLFTLGRGSYTDLVLAFPLLNEKGDLASNWPLQPGFPLFLRNVLYTLGNIRDAVGEAGVQAGEPMVIRPEAGVKSIQVTAPRGQKADLLRGPAGDFTFAQTEDLGVYQVVRDDGKRSSFAVNLLDANESHIEPRPEIQFGSERISTGPERPQARELWKWIILLALILLILEWYIYNRRVSI